jgi:acyl-CoA synthetase (NDP forming)
MAQIKYEQAEKVLRENNLPFVKSFLIKSKEDLNSLSQMSFPLAAKVMSQEIVHKSDMGLVKVNIVSIEDAKKVFDDFNRIVNEKAPSAKIDGVLFQEMMGGTEFIIGLKKDSTFGHVIMFGLGGIYVEVFKDVTFRVCPITKEDAFSMIDEIKSSALLKGIRGSKPADINRIAETLVSLSDIAGNYSEIEEIDLNPLIVDSNGNVGIVDVRILTPTGNL